MNSNGGSLPGNFADLPRSNSNRYRGGFRRGRARANNERSGGQYQRDRRPLQSLRESAKPNTIEEPIDLYDPSQWPSIQEVSRYGEKGKSSATQSSERAAEQEINQDYADLYKESDAHVDQIFDSNSNRNSNTSQRRNSTASAGQYQNNNYSQNNNNSYGNRQTNEKYSNQLGNRGRTRYANVRYYNNHPRRYTKTYGLQGSLVYSSDLPMSPIFVSPSIDVVPIHTDNQAVLKNILGPIKQVEYYFSNDNLIRDSFIRKRMDKDGWVSLDEVFAFKRIKNMKLVFDDFVKQLTTSELLDVDVANRRIRTKIEPQKWVNFEPEAENVSPSQLTNPFPTSGVHTASSAYQTVPYGYSVPYVYPSYEDIYFAQLRSAQQFQIHPAYYQEHYVSHDGSFNHYNNLQYYNSSHLNSVSGYNATNSSNAVGLGGQNQNIFKSESVGDQQVTSSRADVGTKEDDIDELSRKVSNIDVSNPPVSC